MIAPAVLPEAVAEATRRLFGPRLWFAPVRHHSPACALALRALIAEVKPAVVLIEGPEDCNRLIPLLIDPATRPPVAILCQQQTEDDGSRSAFFPFCDYSPEWIALQDGHAIGAELAFIDLAWDGRQRLGRAAPAADDDEADEGHDDSEAITLMAERHLAHSRYLARLAERDGCRDHQELWDRWFELRPADDRQDWRGFFADVYAWCAMARLDYEPAVLEAEGSAPRERRMRERIDAWLARVDGPIVVVTGGFHTPALIDAPAVVQGTRAAEGAKGSKGARAAKVTQVPVATDGAATGSRAASPGAGQWLIRYGYERLDALNGYAAGMPSPMYYQRCWQALTATPSPTQEPLTRVAFDCLTAIAAVQRQRGTADAVSTADVIAAAGQAVRLARLRGHAGPGRHDLLDAMQSCFIKGAIDHGTHGLPADIVEVMRGHAIGDVPASAGSPPLVEDARRLARRHGVRLDDSEVRTSRLDLYRKASHRERSRFFHAMAWLDTGLARWQSGPDFAAGARLELLFEEWRVGWSPLVEARLIALAAEGSSLDEVALRRLLREEKALAEAGEARSAGRVASLIVRACLIGLHARLPALLARVAEHLNEDASLASVLDCGHRLVMLWQAREPLGVQDHPALADLLRRVWPAALYLVPGLAHGPADADLDAADQLLSLRELSRLLAPVLADTALAPLSEPLMRLAEDPAAGPGLCGAACALLFVDGHWSEDALLARIRERFGLGAIPAEAVRFLQGLMRAAPELLRHVPALLGVVNRILAGWDEADFIAHLPDLRDAFTALKPQETADLSDALLALNGATDGAALLTDHHLASAADLLAGTRLAEAMTELMQADGLAAWFEMDEGRASAAGPPGALSEPPSSSMPRTGGPHG